MAIEFGHIVPSSRFAFGWKPNVAYRTFNFRESGSGGRIRTYDQAVNSRPLYH